MESGGFVEVHPLAYQLVVLLYYWFVPCWFGCEYKSDQGHLQFCP